MDLIVASPVRRHTSDSPPGPREPYTRDVARRLCWRSKRVAVYHRVRSGDNAARTASRSDRIASQVAPNGGVRARPGTNIKRCTPLVTNLQLAEPKWADHCRGAPAKRRPAKDDLSVAEVEPPDVAPHEATARVFELALLREREAQLAADRVRWRIVDRREGVDRPVRPFRPRHSD